MDAVEATASFIRIEQLLADARQRLWEQERLTGQSAKPEVALNLLRAMQDAVSLLEMRRNHLRDEMRSLNRVVATESELA